MLESTLQKPELVESIKCVKCGKRNATKNDNMCDNCRFLLTLENIITDRKQASER